jgi:translation initiation factor IF-3
VDVVRVVDEKGEQMGVMPLAQAIQEAKKRGLDLVEVAPQANPVVCKFLDFGKYKYRQEKRERKKQKGQKLKEMRFTSQIEEHDFETKVRHIRRFLEHDDKVKVTVIFRGREIVHMDRGRELLGRLIKKTEGVGKVDQPPKIQGRSLQMVLVPTGMKENEHGQKEEESQGAGKAL